MRRGGGVYVYRTRKPAARLRIPFLSFHFGYVGETVDFAQRHREHMLGGGRYEHAAKPWTDLEPRCVCRIPLPPIKPLMRAVESLLIHLLLPVYNHKGNRLNPRRIPLSTAVRQRRMRDRLGWCWNVRPIHTATLAFLLVLAFLHFGGIR